MGQQEPTADEILLARAEANGYQRGAHKEVDEVCGREKHITKTKKDQDRTLRRYVLWNLATIRKEYAKEGLSVPDEETARKQCLYHGITAPDLVTVKDFIRFYIATSHPKLVDVPTVDSINTVAEWFFAGFTRVTGTNTDEKQRSEVYNWVRYTLTLEGIVVKKHRLKHNFTIKDLSRILLALWNRDDLIFIPERYRVQTTFIIHVYCWTGARLGAFFTDGLRYRDVEPVLQRVSGDEWRFIYRIDQRWVKNNRDPENVVFGAAAKEHKRFFYNDAGFLLAMAIADDALFGYSSFEDLRKQKIPAGQDELVLRFNDCALNQPILRKCTKAGGVVNDPMSKSSFTSIFKSTMTNAGYFCGSSIHTIRRELGKEVDKRYTPVQRSQHLTQGDTRVFGQSYVANCSSVNGQDAFRGEKSDDRHIEYFQSLEKFHEEGLPDKLPAHLEESLSRKAQLCDLNVKVQTLALARTDAQALREAKQRYTNYLKKLRLDALRQYQRHWVKERRDWKILTRGEEVAPDDGRNGLVQRLCLLIPERGRLAQNMASEELLEPGEMWRALQDIHFLCVQDFTVLYLTRSRPVDGACPVKCCQLRMDSLPKNQRNQHIQTCVRWEMASELGHLQSEIHYCYQCFSWVIEAEWQAHCQAHLAAVTSKQCGSVTYCHTLVRPAYCPFCMGQPELPASQRLRPWSRDHKLWLHIEEEHLIGYRYPLACLHPLCNTLQNDLASLRFHLADDHGLSRARLGESATPSHQASQDEVPLDEWAYDAVTCRKRKSQRGTEMIEHHPPKQQKRITCTISPQVISITKHESIHQTTYPRTESDMLSPSSTFVNDIDYMGLDYEQFPTYSTTVCNTIASHPPAVVDDDILFDDYLRSPTPQSSSPEDTASDSSEVTLVETPENMPRGLELDTETLLEFASEDVQRYEIARDQDHRCGGASVPRIQLRVSEPKIMLRLKLGHASQHGKKHKKGNKRKIKRKERNNKILK